MRGGFRTCEKRVICKPPNGFDDLSMHQIALREKINSSKQGQGVVTDDAKACTIIPDSWLRVYDWDVVTCRVLFEEAADANENKRQKQNGGGAINRIWDFCVNLLVPKNKIFPETNTETNTHSTSPPPTHIMWIPDNQLVLPDRAMSMIYHESMLKQDQAWMRVLPEEVDNDDNLQSPRLVQDEIDELLNAQTPDSTIVSWLQSRLSEQFVRATKEDIDRFKVQILRCLTLDNDTAMMVFAKMGDEDSAKLSLSCETYDLVQRAALGSLMSKAQQRKPPSKNNDNIEKIQESLKTLRGFSNADAQKKALMLQELRELANNGIIDYPAHQIIPHFNKNPITFEIDILPNLTTQLKTTLTHQMNALSQMTTPMRINVDEAYIALYCLGRFIQEIKEFIPKVSSDMRGYMIWSHRFYKFMKVRFGSAKDPCLQITGNENWDIDKTTFEFKDTSVSETVKHVIECINKTNTYRARLGLGFQHWLRCTVPNESYKAMKTCGIEYHKILQRVMSAEHSFHDGVYKFQYEEPRDAFIQIIQEASSELVTATEQLVEAREKYVAALANTPFVWWIRFKYLMSKIYSAKTGGSPTPQYITVLGRRRRIYIIRGRPSVRVKGEMVTVKRAMTEQKQLQRKKKN